MAAYVSSSCGLQYVTIGKGHGWNKVGLPAARGLARWGLHWPRCRVQSRGSSYLAWWWWYQGDVLFGGYHHPQLRGRNPIEMCILRKLALVGNKNGRIVMLDGKGKSKQFGVEHRPRSYMIQWYNMILHPPHYDLVGGFVFLCWNHQPQDKNMLKDSKVS